MHRIYEQFLRAVAEQFCSAKKITIKDVASVIEILQCVYRYWEKINHNNMISRWSYLIFTQI
jgi:uncharacterized protein YkvS